MKVSYQWLKDYVNLSDSVTSEELAFKLITSTVEVESIERQGKNLENIVVGEVRKVEKHPDADKLNVCQVFDGVEDFTVVCGGSNVVEGMKVAFGKLGAKVQWHGEGELIELTKAKIRGVESFGMICAASEIGLSEMFPEAGEKEILDLSHLSVKPGISLAEAIGSNDVIFDIDNKSMTNRPDLWGHYGLAREVSVLYNHKLKTYTTKNIKISKDWRLKVKVKDKKLCPRYMGVVIDGVKIGPSPAWLQKRLLSVGLRSINNIVDITNFILLDLGQPMHAFDARQLIDKESKEQEINLLVRKARDGEKFITLDEKEYELDSEMLVIADENKAVALAGVMGGENSGISSDTSTIIFESANFDASSVRQTSLKLGIRTDSSTRFEKSLDPNMTELALKRAVELTLELCPEASVVSNIADESNFKLDQGPIELTHDFIDRKIGVKIDHKRIVKILTSLGFEVKEKKDGFSVMIPTWRATKDISIPEDLIEEISRIYGYDNIESTLPDFPIISPEVSQLHLLERKIKDILSLEAGYTEIYNYSFISPEFLNKLGLDKNDFIELDNPIAKDRPYLRHNIWTGLLENVEENLHRIDQIRFFEIGKVFDKSNPGQRVSETSDDLLPRQDIKLGIVFASKNIEVPFYELSEVLNVLFDRLGLDYKLIPSANLEDKIVHPGRGAKIEVKGKMIGAIGELHPVVQDKLGIENRVALLEINLNELLLVYTEKNNYHPLSVYPEVERDVAFVVDKKIIHDEIISKMMAIDKLIKKVELFDVYQGAKLGADKKSLAYHIVYQSEERTLLAEEVDNIHKQVLESLEKNFKAEIRK